MDKGQVKPLTNPLQKKHRLWAEIDLDRLVHNYQKARSLAATGKIMPVIKAGAYGHGAVQTALTLRAAGADFFAVATPEEALQLRRHGLDCDILLLGVSPVSHLSSLAEAGVTLCVPDIGTARMIQETLGSRPVNVHIKFDTGMTRLGLPFEDAVKSAAEIADNLHVTGLFTHFASADDRSEDRFTRDQFDQFDRICRELNALGLRQTVKHSANSAALIAHPYSHLDYARPGLMLYGYSPCDTPNLQPVLSLYTSVMQLHTVPAGATVSYGRTWTAERESVIATVPVGYADGLSRALSGSGMTMLIGGRRAPLVGRVCMDYCALDVTGVPGVEQGGLVTVLGDGIDASEHARLSGTIPWEILCSIGRRVPRIYQKGGKIVEEINDLDRL